MGGTRKGEAMCRIAANIIQNFRKYSVGLHAKVSRRRSGHGSATLGSLIALGRRLLSVDFVLFLCLFKDSVLGFCVVCKSLHDSLGAENHELGIGNWVHNGSVSFVGLF